jgi:undecaprenyl-diphosphatase
MTKIVDYLKRHYRSLLLLSIAAFALIFFLKLSEDVWQQESIILIDNSIANWAYSIRTPWLTIIMKLITSLASANFIAILFLSLALAFTFQKKDRYSVPLAFTILGSFLFSEGVKLLFSRSRPLIDHALVLEKSFSYPSGHTLIAVTFYGVLVIYLHLALKSKVAESIVTILGTLLIISIGFSRIYLGVHWASDVLASALIGICWLSIVLISIDHKVIIYNFINNIYARLFKKNSSRHR